VVLLPWQFMHGPDGTRCSGKVEQLNMAASSPDLVLLNVVCRFEGDGMVHALRIAGGEGQTPTLTYCNRFMETSRCLKGGAFG
jgi:hypothetical protein